MREGISIEVSAADCERLAAVVADRNSPQKQTVTRLAGVADHRLWYSRDRAVELTPLNRTRNGLGKNVLAG